MNQILALGNRLSTAVLRINRLKDIWLESRIRGYANDVRARYPDRLNPLEKVFRPLIVRRVTGTVANLISAIRLLLAVIIFLLLIIDSPHISPAALAAAALGTFIIAGFLDLLDGPAARALDEISELGKALDPFADKMLLAAPLLILGYTYLPGPTYWSVISLESFLMLIAGVKVAVRRMPFTMATQANMFGKVKNIVELVAGGFLFLCPFADIFIIISGTLFLASIPLAGGSIVGYLTSIRRIKR